jgi:hypothetical protein
MKFFRVTGSTFSPKPRNIPRILNSTSISRPRSCLRAIRSARISCASTDFACTGRNQPIRINWAIPRASLRSVLTVIADNAAFTCRVSSRTVSYPAPFSPACSHCDNGPASSPIRFTAKPSVLKNSTKASGSLATFASSSHHHHPLLGAGPITASRLASVWMDKPGAFEWKRFLLARLL